MLHVFLEKYKNYMDNEKYIYIYISKNNFRGCLLNHDRPSIVSYEENPWLYEGRSTYQIVI